MSGFFTTHGRTRHAEWLKLQRTGLLWMCLGAGAFIPVLMTIVSFVVKRAFNEKADVWNKFLESGLTSFAGFFFPLFLIIMITRIVYIEYRSDTWKLLETQPVTRFSIFLAKFEIALLIALLSLVINVLFTLAGGALLQALKPEQGFGESSIKWAHLGSILFRFWIASFGLLALQYFLVLLMKNFAWPVTIGLIGIIAASILRELGYATWLPYAAIQLTGSSIKGSNTGAWLLHHEKLSIAWCLLFLFLAYRYFKGRGFANGYYKKPSLVAATVGAIAAFGVIFWWVNRPVVLGRYHRGVVAGIIESEKPAKDIYLLRAPANDTLAMGKVLHNSFHLALPQNLPGGYYQLITNVGSLKVFLSGKDSLYVDWRSGKWGNNNIKFGGTLLAENEWAQRNVEPSYMLEYGLEETTPKAYAANIMEEWESMIKSLDRFKTVDNVRPSDDYIKLQRKVIAARLLKLTDVTYPETFAIYNPNDTLRYPASIDRLRKEVAFSDPTLAGMPEFTSYISDYLRWKAQNNNNRDSAFFNMLLDSVKNTEVRDAVLFSELRNRISGTNDSLRRAMYLVALLPQMKNERYRHLIADEAERLNKLRRGQKASPITSESLAEKRFTLQDLYGRYVIIDVWATWCGPCVKESPYFEELAEKYTSDRVAFVALSVDEDKTAWKAKARNKSRRVLQLIATDANGELNKQYALSTIPRFIMIDPKGNLLSAQMPRPSDPEFENMLQREIAFLRAN